MEQEIVSRNQIISKFLQIGHGNLELYSDVGIKAAKHEPELLAHFLCWNTAKGEVRDSKVALPVCAFRGDPDYYENAMANLCLLDPRNLHRALQFNQLLSRAGWTLDGAGKVVKEGVQRYLMVRQRSRKWVDRSILQHRISMKNLYKFYHVKPSKYVDDVLFKNKKPAGSIFEVVSRLKYMPPKEAAGHIVMHNLPYLIIVKAVPKIKESKDLILAMIEVMSGNELITNTNKLKKLGVFNDPVLKRAYEDAAERARTDKRASSLKAGRAAEVVKSEKVVKKLQKIQDEQLDRLGGIEGDWLILGDCSGSMETSIEVAKYMASLIAQQVKGKVWLVFFNTMPRPFDVSGKSLDDIKKLTKGIRASGGTSVGVGLDWIYRRSEIVNGIVLCSDGGENGEPRLKNVYKKYCKKFGIEPTLTHLHVPGEADSLSGEIEHWAHEGSELNFQYDRFELGESVDYYSLPNIVKTLKSNRYALVDEVLAMPLIGFNDVFK